MKKMKKFRRTKEERGEYERCEADHSETTSPLERFFGAMSYRVRSTMSVCTSGFNVGWKSQKKDGFFRLT